MSPCVLKGEIEAQLLTCRGKSHLLDPESFKINILGPFGVKAVAVAEIGGLAHCSWLPWHFGTWVNSVQGASLAEQGRCWGRCPAQVYRRALGSMEPTGPAGSH